MHNSTEKLRYKSKDDLSDADLIELIHRKIEIWTLHLAFYFLTVRNRVW